MANEEHLPIIQKGVKTWNQWRIENPGVVPEFPNADLKEADLRGADLRSATLYSANLGGANLSRANLGGANLSWANLRGANLNWALLHGTDFTMAKMSKMSLEMAEVFYTAFCHTDLSDVKGLEDVQHRGPSIVDIHTIYRSMGNIPETFLRGAGVPDVFIEYMGSLVGKAVEYYSCFISHSSKDQAIAERIHADLQNNGVRCWLASHDLRIGEKYKTGIDKAIRFHDKLLLILSENAIESGWVENEVEKALEKERESDQLGLYPIRIDDTVMEVNSGWAAHIRKERHIGDFRDWKSHDAYQDVFQRLLRDLKMDQRAPTPAAVFTKPHRPHQAIELDEERIKLKSILVEHFNDSELRDLYDDLNVDYENVSGETKGDKARELVTYFERHRPGGLAMLAEYVRDKRPYALN